MQPLMLLTNHLLIAMPKLADPYFFRSVTYIFEHSEKGAMGIVINQPILNISLGNIFEEMHIVCDIQEIKKRSVLSGGPVRQERGFVLHNKGSVWKSTVDISDTISVTTSPDILDAIAHNQGPPKTLFALGYASWQKGQLEKELLQNAWLYGEATPKILFDTPYQDRWRLAAKTMGIDITNISDDIGHA